VIMTRKVLLDANLFIGAFDREATTSPERKDEAKRVLGELLHDTTAVIFSTALIRYEVLRGVAWRSDENYQTLKGALCRFVELDISREVSDLAANLYRYDVHEAEGKKENRNFEKRKFDVFHFATARCHGLELKSIDGDIETIENLYRRYQSNTE